jgi:hypothetical protein
MPAVREGVTTKEGIEERFRSKGIPFTAFDPKPAFERFNVLIREDGIRATPTCVVIRNVKKETFVGGQDIIKALEGLK